MISRDYILKWRALLVRLGAIGWRMVCLAYTAVRHPRLWRRAAILLRYDTPAQKEAFKALAQNKRSDEPHRVRALIVVPFRDKWAMTEQCVVSIKAQQHDGVDLLVALIDNGSVEPATEAGIAALLKGDVDQRSNEFQIRALRYDLPFNFSLLNNLAVKDCDDFAADFVIFMNNDVILEDAASLNRLVSFLSDNPSAASVGCTLLYPDRRIQHLCIAVGVKVVGAHPCKGLQFDASDPWYSQPRSVGAATAALLAVRRNDFAAVGGFDEQLATCYQDVDLALKFTAKGKTNWVLPDVVAIHHETSTRQPVHHWREVSLMYQRWGRTLEHNPFYSSAFSRWSEHPALTLGEGYYPWRLLAKGR